MKKLNYLMLMLFAMVLSMSFTACSDNDDEKKEQEEIHNVHYDIWVTLGETSGMGSSSAVIVKNVNTLEDANQSIAFLNEGTDVSAKLYQESIVKGKYYYQIPKEKDRFGKYQITNSGINTIAEHKFEKNTYQDRRYTHTWTGDNELVVLAANGDKKDVIWTKFNANDMSIVAEGSLNLPNFTPEVITYSTSGLATYRKSDNKLLYFFCEKFDSGRHAGEPDIGAYHSFGRRDEQGVHQNQQDGILNLDQILGQSDGNVNINGIAQHQQQGVKKRAHASCKDIDSGLDRVLALFPGFDDILDRSVIRHLLDIIHVAQQGNDGGELTGAGGLQLRALYGQLPVQLFIAQGLNRHHQEKDHRDPPVNPDRNQKTQPNTNQ